MEEKLFWYWFCSNINLSRKIKRYLLDRFMSPKNLFIELEKGTDTGLPDKYEEKLSQCLNYINRAESEYHKLGHGNIEFITIADKEYPAKLKHIYDPPFGLFIKGKLPDPCLKTVAIVGARECSHYGRETAAWFGRELAAEGVQIISGMALGIDSGGLYGALDSKGAVFGIPGSGPDVVYPPENKKLYEGIYESGGVISEYPPGEKPYAYHFPERNRIISAFSDCVAVIEAREKSGSLITANFALEQGKDVVAVPGRHNDILSRGTNSLIKSGAYLVSCPHDILDIIGIEKRIDNKIMVKEKFTLDKTKEKVYSCLHLEPKYIETIIEESELSYGEVIEILVEMELDGMIKQTSKNYYAVCIGRGRDYG